MTLFVRYVGFVILFVPEKRKFNIEVYFESTRGFL